MIIISKLKQNNQTSQNILELAGKLKPKHKKPLLIAREIINIKYKRI